MQFIYLLIGVAILIAWIGPAVLIILVVIGIVGLVVYALKDHNNAALKPPVGQNDIIGPNLLTPIDSIESKNSSDNNIIEPTVKNHLTGSELNKESDEDTINNDVANMDVLSVPEQCNAGVTPDKMPNWNDYLFTQKQKAAHYRASGMFPEEVLLIEETIKTLEREGISCEYWIQLYKTAVKNSNGSAIPTIDHIDIATNNNNRTVPTEDDILHQQICKDDKQEKMDVPMWVDTYIWSIDDLRSGTTSQQQFYRYFKEQFLKGNYIDIDGNTNYAFLLMYDLSNTYRYNISLLEEYYEHLIEICPKVELYTRRILKDIIVDTKKQELKRQLAKYADNQQAPCKWISVGEDIVIGEIKLGRGGFYVGNCFKLPKSVINRNKSHYDCSYIYGPVINPDLPIKQGEVENEPFCSYQDMTPNQRYAYLQWLSGSNPIEETCVDLIRYYVYGLEIRLFIDQSVLNERKQILFQLSKLYKELKSLDRKIYRDYYQLTYPIKQIINAGIIKYHLSPASDFLPEEELISCDNYIDHVINQELKGKTELTSEDAYKIAKKTYLLRNLPIGLYENNIKDEFVSLFQQKFKKRAIVPRSEYYTGNSHYISTHEYGNIYCPENVKLEIQLPKLSIDAWWVRSPISNIVSKLQEDFSSYNGCMEWTNNSTPLALLQLPQYIELGDGNKVGILQEYLYSILDKCEYCLIDVDSLLDKIGYIRKNEKSLYLQPIQAITNSLKKLNVGITPLIDVDNKRLNFGDKCIIYKIKGVSQVKRTDTYSRLELFVKLVVLLIQADRCDENDVIFVENYIDSQSDTSSNTIHLKAYFRWLQHKKLPFDKGTKDSISKLLNKGQCKQIAHLLLKLSCNQGYVNNQRVEVLTKIYPLLGEDVNNIHSQIHRMLIDDEDFVTVEVTTDAKEYVIAQPEGQSIRKQKIVKIDTAKLSKLEVQTASAQNMLAEIFNENEIEQPIVTTSDSLIMGILTELSLKNEWTKAEIECLCEKYNVLVGALLEQINDYAYDKIGDIVIEDCGDKINVSVDYIKDMI